VKIPKVPGRRAINIATPEQFLKVRACLPTKPAQVFSTLLVSSGAAVLWGDRAAVLGLRCRKSGDLGPTARAKLADIPERHRRAGQPHREALKLASYLG
jgi:hypothetical protein